MQNSRRARFRFTVTRLRQLIKSIEASTEAPIGLQASGTSCKDAVITLKNKGHSAEILAKIIGLKLEDYLHVEACAGHISIEQAQCEIADDWIAAYRKYLGEP